MKIPDKYSTKTQMSVLGNHKWSVARLFQLSKDLPVMEVPLDHIDISKIYTKLTMRQMVMHFNAVKTANLNYPIILDEDGEIMDGRHRIMKAMMLRKKTIKAVRFDENPYPCKVIDPDLGYEKGE